jgi:hypothetical protein
LIGIAVDGEAGVRLTRILDGVGGLGAGPISAGAVPGLVVVMGSDPARLWRSVHADSFVPVLSVVESLEEAIAAVTAGAGDAVLLSAGEDEIRLRARLLLERNRGRACSAQLLEKLLRAELSRSDREGGEISLIHVRPTAGQTPGNILAEALAGGIRATDHTGVTSDGAVIVILPGTPLHYASLVARRLRSSLEGRPESSSSFRVAGGRIGHLTPPEVVRLLSRAPELP